MKTVDESAARELFLFAIHTGELYRSRTTKVLDNLAARVARGDYEHHRATQAFQHVADDAARRHTLAHDSRDARKGPNGSFGIFNKPTRADVAAQLAAYYAEEILSRALELIGPRTVVVCAHDFGHDQYGNPTAHYAVGGIPQTGKRVQCGYSDYRMDGAGEAIRKAGFRPDWYEPNYSSAAGSRSEDALAVTFNRKAVTVGPCSVPGA